MVGDPRRRLTLAPPAGAVHPLGVGGAVVVPGPFLRGDLKVQRKAWIFPFGNKSKRSVR
ncbi:Uncharacterised protein [Kocuria rosea]|nr:Uncharacterised protein [Kocuria rosea]